MKGTDFTPSQFLSELDDQLIALAVKAFPALMSILDGPHPTKEKLEASRWLIGEAQKIQERRGSNRSLTPADEIMIQMAREVSARK